MTSLVCPRLLPLERSRECPLLAPLLLTRRPTCPLVAAAAVANLVLSESYERVFHPPTATFADIPRGVFLVRGENVVLIGEVVRPAAAVARPLSLFSPTLSTALRASAS